MKKLAIKTHFTRKNLIFLGLMFFYCLCALIGAVGCDASGMMKEGNPIQAIGTGFGFPLINGSIQSYILIVLFLIYVLFFTAAFIYEMRLAKYYENKIWSKKWAIIYGSTFLISLALWLTIGLIAQYPYNAETIGNSFLFLIESLFVGFVIYVLLASIIAAIIVLYVNFKNIDKPFKFFSNKADLAMEEDYLEEEQEKLEAQDNLAASFGEEQVNQNGEALSSNGANINSNGTGQGVVTNVNDELKDKEKVFPGLCSIDFIMDSQENNKTFDDDVTLEELVSNFRNYLAKVEKLYFDKETIRAFISGLAASRLIILEGLSGTGKSSLARYFSEFIGEKSFFEPVQATRRDRTSLLGYYNDFSKTYNETEFLKKLYQATFLPNNINIMVLDELNISRVEYYFADFLSILEYPIDQWKLKILQLPYDFEAPMHLENGILDISPTTWFVGTANKDDSTYTITDKVYDRAITISFDDRNEPFEVVEDVKKINLSYTKLISLFTEAQETKAYQFNKEDYLKFKKLTDFTYDTFDVTFGNRILHQIELLVPVYVASGGKKEEALDFIFARKIIFKLQGRFEDYIKNGLNELLKIINDTYGNDSFKNTKHEISRLLRKL